jgi:hypothetical protein
MSCAPDRPTTPVHAREEATTLGLALVADESIRNRTARWLLDDLNRQVDEIEAKAREAKTK